MSFRTPVKDILYSLTEVAGGGDLVGLARYDGYDLETVSAVIEAAAALADDVWAPLNVIGDQIGARLEAGEVKATPGFKAAFEALSEQGWVGLAADPEFGGQGLPKALEIAAFEGLHSANLALGLAPLLTQGAVEALSHCGTPAQKTKYLPNMIAGVWTGAMNLTEPQAGSDLGALRTVAEPDGQGGYLLTGQKIYITWGDHDIASNIVHLVLARTPDAPAGARGISLFVTSKYAVDAEGGLGPRQPVTAVGLEHKLGIHGSPTCVMAFDRCPAELVGELNQGLAHMFIMMNAARLGVGVQGLAIAERAYQAAYAYAADRRQGKSPITGEANAPIVDHPDVRRMLAVSRAKILAARGVCLSTAVASDLARALPDADARARAKRREDLLTPIAKAWSTDVGCEVASTGIQIHGGMGFIEETGAAQHYRDARITPIYEGTNGIQAGDLIGRKLGSDGAAMYELIEDIRASCGELAGSASILSEVTEAVLAMKRRSPAEAAAVAYPYLTLAGEIIGAWMLAKGAQAAYRRLAAGDSDTAWLQAQIELFRLYQEQVLVQAPARLQTILAGGAVLERLAAETLASS